MDKSGQTIVQMIHQVCSRALSSCELSQRDIEGFLRPSRKRGYDYRFMVMELAEKKQIDFSGLMATLYAELTRENEKRWHDRAFFGMYSDDNAIYFRVVDDSTA